MNEQQTSDQRCERVVSASRSRTYLCCKPARFRVWFGAWPAKPMCGVHANQAKRRGGNVLPLGKP